MAIPLSDQVPTAAAAGDRRQGRDRRARPTTLLSACRWKGRRRSFRRASEARRAYVDRLAPATVAVALFIVVCSILDALFTLLHLQSGGREVNPLMHLALCAGLPVFLGAKTAGTGLGVVILAAHQNFLLAWRAIQVLAVAYAVLLGYHFTLFLRG